MDILKVEGVLETALYVSDLKVSITFYKRLFNLETLMTNESFCALNVSEKQVLLLFLKDGAAWSKEEINVHKGPIPPHGGTGSLHLAFSIMESDLIPWRNLLNTNRIKIESEYKWERGGTSLYFRDPDNHLLELATPGLWSIY
ncbi:Glutathione transferase FosA [Arenibacter antarcticus]|uniref:VOC family protein n=1 Tax=Arenibacter antarcticus TaxID=2040469 RepID=A0ABW5VIT5_9FLAO|nr:VOC family protein [Arenibacter sp. H213]MCM4166485.1 glyoxalase [Arenibacter sp. H213]